MKSFVISLLNGCCPTAVCFFIVAINVNPVDTHALGPLPHILEEVREGHPPVANLNSTASVQAELCVVGVRTSLLHSVPASINTCPASFSGHAVCQHPVGANFRAKASATLSLSVSEFAQVDACLVPAIAFAKPVSLPAASSVELNRCQHTELYSGRVNLVVPAASLASAGFSSATSKRVRRDGQFSSAIAFAKPPRPTRTVVFCSANNSQPRELLTSDVFQFCHCLVSFAWIVQEKTNKRKAITEEEVTNGA